MFDAYELVGGMSTADISCSVAMYCDLRAEGLFLPVIGSSDNHNIEAEARMTDVFRATFIGRIGCVRPSAEILELEDRHRRIHIEKVPITNGSDVDSDIVSRQM